MIVGTGLAITAIPVAAEVLRELGLLHRPVGEVVIAAAIFDDVLGLILLGNNFINILASAIATVIALRLYGEAGIAIATGLLTMVLLVGSPRFFADAMANPKDIPFAALATAAAPMGICSSVMVRTSNMTRSSSIRVKT